MDHFFIDKFFFLIVKLFGHSKKCDLRRIVIMKKKVNDNGYGLVDEKRIGSMNSLSGNFVFMIDILWREEVSIFFGRNFYPIDLHLI